MAGCARQAAHLRQERREQQRDGASRCGRPAAGEHLRGSGLLPHYRSACSWHGSGKHGLRYWPTSCALQGTHLTDEPPLPLAGEVCQ